MAKDSLQLQTSSYIQELQARITAALEELDGALNRFNRSGDDTLMVSADYLEVVMTKK